MKVSVCELCNGKASLYCVSDSAFLCWDCDARVHEANFLVARHVRQILCVKCNGIDRDQISGVGYRPKRSICESCVARHVDHSSSSLSSSSSCSSSLSDCMSSSGSAAAPKRFSRNNLPEIRTIARSRTDTNPKKRKTLASEIKGKKSVDVKAEGILVNWYRRLGLNNASVVPLALQATEICLTKMPILPLRVCLASSLWFSIKSCEPRETSTCQLKRLVQCSGVPAKSLFTVESKLIKILKKAGEEDDDEEGWAECSD